MAHQITLVKDFDINKLSYMDVRTLETGGKMVYTSYNKSPLVIQTPLMYAPFGLQKWTNDGKDKYTLNLSFRGMDSSKSLQTFHKMLNDLDRKLVEDGFANQASWFKGKKYNSTEVLEALYTPLITPAKDKNTGEVTDKYPATFKVSMPQKDGQFKCEVYDDKENAVDILAMNTKGARMSAIIQFAGLWFAGGKFGSSWKVVQLLVKPNQNISGFAFKRDEDDTLGEQDDMTMNEDDPKEVVVANGGLSMATHGHLVDSDEEHDTPCNTPVGVQSDDDLETTASPKKTTAPRKVTMRKKE